MTSQNIDIKENIIAVFSQNPKTVVASGVPILLCKNQKDLDKQVMDLCRVTFGTPHKIGENIFIIKR